MKPVPLASVRDTANQSVHSIRGLANMMRGGSGNTSNKLMQARVLLQFIALVLILLGAYVAGRF